VAEHGCPDILVNNAGIQIRGPLTDIPADDWQRVIATNLTGSFVAGRVIARYMLPRRSGKIINICSVQNHLVRASTGPYAAAKSGLGGLTRAMCAEWAASGLQVNGLAPGYLDTELNASLVADPEFTRWITRRTPAARWGRVEDVVGPAIWLASPAADFVNGQVIYVDGGMTAVI
jgi:gluconate 5-dehydrogenase